MRVYVTGVDGVSSSFGCCSENGESSILLQWFKDLPFRPSVPSLFTGHFDCLIIRLLICLLVLNSIQKKREDKSESQDKDKWKTMALTVTKILVRGDVGDDLVDLEMLEPR